MPSFFLTLVTLAASTTAALAQHAEHGNHSADWEWAGGFESLANSTLALASNGIDHVMVLVIAADEADEHGIEESEEAAEAIWDAGNATEVEHGGTLSNTNVLYELHLDESFLNLFTVALNATGPQIIFFEHAPSELEFKHPAMHYIKSSIDGEDIEPTAVEAAGHGEEAATPAAAAHDDDHAGEVFLACLVITLISLVGIVMLSADIVPPGIKDGVPAEATVAFASGALLAAMAVIMVPESLKLLASAHPGEEEETKVNCWFAIMLLAGFLCVASVEWIANAAGCGHGHGGPSDGVEAITHKTTALVAVADAEQGKLVGVEGEKPAAAGSGPSSWAPVVWSVLLGDLFHNFVDGITIGIAFKSCDSNFGWVVAGGAAAHEVPQEIADYIILTSRGHMTKAAALGFNLLSGSSCIVGGLIAANTDMSDELQALLLAFGAGTYLFIATVECFPSVVKAKKPAEILTLAGMFMLGVACIVIAVNTGHEHCEVVSAAVAAGGADPHAGHAGH